MRDLHGYSQLPVMENYAEADPQTKQQISALLTITEELEFEYRIKEARIANTSPNVTPMELGIPLSIETGTRIHGDNLISLILERPENAPELAQSILRDGITDANLLRDIYTSGTPALRDGII